MSGRVASFNQTTSLMANLSRLQSQAAKITKQQSSGVREDSYGGFGSSSQMIISLENEHSQITTINENAKLAQMKIDAIYKAMGSMTEELANLRSNIGAAITGNLVSSAEVQRSAENSLINMTSLLNTSYAEKFLFSGGMTSTKPIDFTDPNYTMPTHPSTPDSAYYQGDHYALSVESKPGIRIEYGVTADNPAFEQAFRGIQLVANNPSDPDAISEAYELITQAIEGIAILQATVSDASNRLNIAIDNNEAFLISVEENIQSLKSVDLAELSLKYTEYETQLQASYGVLVKLMNLKLSDYMR